LIFFHERLDHLVGKLFARGVDDLFVGEVLAYFMADGVQQVRLAEPDMVPLGPAEMPESDSSWPVGSTVLPLHRSIKALIGVQRGATNTAHLKIFRQ